MRKTRKNSLSFCEARRKCFREPFYFLWSRVGHQTAARGRPARRAEVALLLFVEEGRQPPNCSQRSPGAQSRGGPIISCGGGAVTKLQPEAGRRVKQRWPYYFLWRKNCHQTAARGRPAPRTEVASLFLVEGGLKSNNPN